MSRATPYSTAQLTENWDAIVIGSGMGGLTAAVLLARHASARVLVLERHGKPGGATHSFGKAGYRWDVGLHYLGQMQPGEAIRRAFDHVTGRAIRWQAMPDVYDRFQIGDQLYEFPSGRERLQQRFYEWFPREVRAIERYFKSVESSNHSSLYYYAEKALPGWLHPFLGRSLRGAHMHWARQTTAELLKHCGAGPELSGVLTGQWGDYGLPPAASSFATHATIVGHYLDGAAYPVGGSSVLAQSMIPLIEAQGGAVVVGAEVSEILLERGRAAGVRMKDGREFRAPRIVSDAGAEATFSRLLPQDLSSTRRLRTRIAALPRSTAHLSLYVGLSQSGEALKTDAGNLWVYPGYDHDANVAQFAQDIEAPLPMVYLSFPSAKDPQFQSDNPGKSTIEAITTVPYEHFSAWAHTERKQREASYEALKERLSARMRATLERVCPAVSGHIEHIELGTPLSTRHYLNTPHGEIYGLAATPARYALGLGARTPVRGLYLTGQDVTTPGVAAALLGGILCASVALGRNLMRTVVREG